MRTICSICLDEVGKEPLITIVNCGHVFDLKCIRECLKSSYNCPICRKSVHCTQASQLCRVFLTTETDDNPSECLKLKNDLAANAKAMAELREKFTNSESQTKIAQRNLQSLLKICDKNKAKLDAATKELTDTKSAYLEEVQRTSKYADEIKDLTLSKNNHTNEVADLKKKNESLARELQSQRDKCTAMAKKRNYEKEYLDLQKSFNDLLAKQSIINSKYIEIAISGTPNPEEIRSHIQDLERQLTVSKAREDKLFADVKRLAKKKADIYTEKQKLLAEKQKISNDKKRIMNENQHLQGKLSSTNEDVSKLKEYKANWVAENKSLQEQLKNARENVSKLQEYKQNWIAENRTLHQNLKVSKENIKNLQNTQKKIIAEKQALQKKLNDAERSNSNYATHRSIATTYVARPSTTMPGRYRLMFGSAGSPSSSATYDDEDDIVMYGN
ncbi:hypothetical protein PS15p_201513 [Mucor circinelloides]